MSLKRALLSTVTGLGFTAGLATAAISEEITIATVNNADMITMQELAPAWEKQRATVSIGLFWKKTYFANGLHRISPQMVAHSISCLLEPMKRPFGERMAG